MIGDLWKKHVYDPDEGKPVTSAPPSAAAPPPIQPATASAGAAAPLIDPNMLADIQRVVARRANSAFSFLEEKANTLRGAGLDEATATRAAFQLLKADGKSAEAVISSIDLHVRDIEMEKSAFASGAKAASDQKVAKLRTDATNLTSVNALDETSIAQLNEQIQQIRARIDQRSSMAAQMQTDADAAELDIAQKVNQFTAAADSVVSSLNSKKMTLSSVLS